jgi:hypothetical protein
VRDRGENKEGRRERKKKNRRGERARERGVEM